MRNYILFYLNTFDLLVFYYFFLNCFVVFFSIFPRLLRIVSKLHFLSRIYCVAKHQMLKFFARTCPIVARCCYFLVGFFATQLYMHILTTVICRPLYDAVNTNNWMLTVIASSTRVKFCVYCQIKLYLAPIRFYAAAASRPSQVSMVLDGQRSGGKKSENESERDVHLSASRRLASSRQPLGRLAPCTD